jgi:hypothetical protein
VPLPLPVPPPLNPRFVFPYDIFIILESYNNINIPRDPCNCNPI